MADYYSRTVIKTLVALTPLLYRTLELQGAGFDVTGDSHETILDGIVNERPPMSVYYVYFTESWSDNQGAEEYLSWADTDDLSPEDLVEFTRLLDLESQDLLHEVLKLNPELDEIEVQCSYSCSKMRTDGFGGHCLIVNKRGWLFNSTNDWQVNANGTIEARGSFMFWEPEHATA